MLIFGAEPFAPRYCFLLSFTSRASIGSINLDGQTQADGRHSAVKDTEDAQDAETEDHAKTKDHENKEENFEEIDDEGDDESKDESNITLNKNSPGGCDGMRQSLAAPVTCGEALGA